MWTITGYCGPLHRKVVLSLILLALWVCTKEMNSFEFGHSMHKKVNISTNEKETICTYFEGHCMKQDR